MQFKTKENEQNILNKLGSIFKSKSSANIEVIPSQESEENSILRKANIRLGLDSVQKIHAIKMAGQLLHEGGYVEHSYIEAMLEREEQLSTYIGNGVAIPHGTGAAKNKIKNSGMVFLQFPNGIEFGDEIAYLVIGIAGTGNDHLTILSNIATAIDDKDLLSKLTATKDVQTVYDILTEANQ